MASWIRELKHMYADCTEREPINAALDWGKPAYWASDHLDGRLGKSRASPRMVNLAQCDWRSSIPRHTARLLGSTCAQVGSFCAAVSIRVVRNRSRGADALVIAGRRLADETPERPAEMRQVVEADGIGDLRD